MRAFDKEPGWWRRLGLSLGLGLTGCAAATAQTILSGTVRDAAGQPLTGVLLEAETRPQPPATAFAVSAADGSFRLQLAASPGSDSVYLHVRALGYTGQLRRLGNRSQPLRLTLLAQPAALREVVVRAPPLTRHRDTLNYMVGAFAGKQDRVIADVLKKMPGLEVDADGRISYQGSPINQFYINGQNLLDGRYTLASENLPADAVQSVQVLERHQPVRALEGSFRPEEAAINLQLKKKVTFTGQVQAGAGGAPAPAGALWRGNLSPMLFTSRLQLLDTYQTNNTGQDLSRPLTSLTEADLPPGSEPAGSPVPELLRVVGPGRAPVGLSCYLFNRAHLLSANHLLPVGPEHQLRVNVSYLHDAQRAGGSTQTRLLLPDQQAVVLTENQTTQLALNHLLADLTLTRNLKRYYLNNALSLAGRWDGQTGEVQRPETGLRISQAARTPSLQVRNQLGLVRALGGGQLRLASLVRFSDSPQQLTVSPGPLAPVLTGGLAYYSARQQARLTTFFTSSSAELTGSRGNWEYSGLLGVWQEVQQLNSALTTAGPPTLPGLPVRGALRWYRARYYLEPGLSYQASTWSLRLRAPLSYYAGQASDAQLAAGQPLQLPAAEPSLSASRSLGRYWRLTADAGLSTTLGDITHASYAYLLRDYRTLERSTLPLLRTQTQRYAGGFYFQDPLRARFLSATYTLSSAWRNLLYSNQVAENGALTILALDQPNRSVNQLLQATLSQFVSAWKTNLSLQVLGNWRQQAQVLNGQPADTRSQNGTATLKASLSALTWSSLEGQASFSALRSQVSDGPASPAAYLQEHRASLHLFPVGGHQLTVSADYYASQGPGAAVYATFADLLYRYTLVPAKGRKLDLELSWNNLFDTRYYQHSFVSEFSLAQTTYELRPAQLLASVRMSL